MLCRAMVLATTLGIFGMADSARADAVGQTLQLPPQKQAALAQLWPLEQSIYAVRGPENLAARLNNYSTNFMAWPPMMNKPEAYEAFKENESRNVSPGKRRIDVEFVDMTLDGDTAVMYTRTHLTMMADGTPISDFYNVIHVYVRREGQWKVIAGLARLDVSH